MKSCCKDFNCLFFVKGSKLKKELDIPKKYDDFVIILDERINLCKDEKMLDIDKLKKMYNIYMLRYLIKIKIIFMNIFLMDV